MKRSTSLLGITATLLAGTISCGSMLPASSADTTRLIAVAGSISDVDARFAAIESRLNDAYSSGRLTSTQVAKYRQDLKGVAAQEAVFNASNGSLNLWENLKLQFELDDIVKNMEASLTDRKSGFMDVEVRRDQVARRLNDAFAQGRLTRQEFEEVTADLDRVNRNIAAAKGASGQIAIADNIRLVIDVDRLSQRLTRTVHSRQFSLTSIDVRQSEINKQIEEGTTSGKLTVAEATELKAEFQRIGEEKERLRKVNRPLTADEQLNLALELEKLSAMVASHMTDNDAVVADPSRVAKRHAEIDKNIATSLASGLITLTEAQVLLQQLDQIGVRERDFNQSGMDPLKVQTLIVELEQVNGNVDRISYGRKPVWPGIKGTIDEVTKRLADAKAASRLSAEDEAAITQELNNISINSQNLSNDARANLQLAAALNALSTRVTRSVKDRDIAYIPDLERRKVEISKRIGEGVVSGKLTLDEANSAMAEFNRINSQANNYRNGDGVIDEREKLSLALELERLSTRVEKDIRDGVTTSKPLATLRENADQAIAAGTLSGKLTAQEVQSLRAELNRLMQLESTKVVQGKAEGADAIAISFGLTKLIRDTDNATKNGELALPDIAKRQAELYQRITEGVMQGRLSVKDSDDLKKGFYRILDQEAKFKASGGLSFGEHAALSLELERLANSIEASMGDSQAAVPNVDERQAALDAKLASAIASGQLTMAQSQEFSKELDRINRDEIAYRFSGTGLSYAESISLVADLEKLSGRIDTQIAGQTARWAGVDGRLQALNKQVGEALLAQKINSTTASTLKRELDRVGQAKLAFEASGGGLNLAETESLVRDLDRLARGIEIRQGTGQIIAWTDIDGRQARAEARIAQDTAQKKLSPSKANKARRELDSFKAVKASWKHQSGGTFSYSQIVTMAQTLDKIDNLVGIAPVPGPAAAPPRNQ